MNKLLLAFLLMSLPVVTSARANPPDSPILLSHTLATYIVATNSVTLNYVLHLENIGGETITFLTLRYVPLNLISENEILLEIGSLDPNTNKDIIFSIITPMMLDKDQIEERPFFWAAQGYDSISNFIEFPVVSQPTVEGGMQ